MVARALAVVLLLSACNLAFGIDETNLVNTDRDHDDVADTDDNCPDVANDQADDDDDGFGNACDLCRQTRTTHNHDDDDDGVGDACDRCPGFADFQDDGNEDLVGDACVGAQGLWTRVLFEPFVDIDRWTVRGGVPWVAADDAAGPTMITDGGIDAPVTVTGNRFAISLGTMSSTRWPPGDRVVGIDVRDRLNDNTLTSCYASCDPAPAGCTLWVLTPGSMPVPSGGVVSTPRATLRFFWIPAGGGMYIIGCSLGAVTATFFEPSLSVDLGTITLVASPSVQLSYVDHIQ